MAWNSTFTNIATKNPGDTVIAADTNQLDDNDQQIQANVEALKGGVLGVAPTTTLEAVAATVASISTDHNIVTGNYTVLDSDGYRTIICNSATGDYTITFPTLADNNERDIRVLNNTGTTKSDCTTNSATAVVTMASTTGILAGMKVYGNNVNAAVTVSTVDSGLQITLSANCNKTEAGTAILEFANTITVDGEGAETIDGMTTIQLSRKGDKIDCHGISTDEWKILDERVTCQLILHTSDGYGSADTAIEKFTTNAEYCGNYLTHNHGAYGTDGLEVVIQRPGKCSIVYTSTYASVGYMGLSLNSTQLTTDIDLIDRVNRLSVIYGYTASVITTTSYTGRFKKGDIIRPHLEATFGGTATDSNACIWVSYLGN